MEMIISDQELERAGFYWRATGGVTALVCAPLEKAGFVNGFSTRAGGTSPMPENSLNLAGFNEDAAENILENRRRFLKLFPGEWALAGCWQMHGVDVRAVKDRDDAKPAEDGTGETVYCDAIVSDAPHVLAGVKTADCVPLLIGDERTGSFAAVHAGWRGTFAGIVFYALERMGKEYGARPEDVTVAIGPAAASCCYEVGPEVITGFRERFADAETLFSPTREHHACIDLLKANRDQLLSSGVDSKKIYTAPLCTMCRTDLFFSYRREKQALGKVGRLMSVIGRMMADR
ncbi:MAG TPA: peptidoglycan editing factor PgeF [Pyrinomonadaceae bacterium]|nr:peptidoglycan editing factor PgeF [Pyrinomonadaceae bacterium]